MKTEEQVKKEERFNFAIRYAKSSLLREIEELNQSIKNEDWTRAVHQGTEIGETAGGLRFLLLAKYGNWNGKEDKK